MNTKRKTQTSTRMLRYISKWASLVLMAMSMLSVPSSVSAADTEAGKVIFIFGQAWKHSVDGGKYDLKRGMAVNVGETIETSSNGQVQIRMNDNGLIAIRPGSQFKIQAFKFSGVDGAGSSEDKSYFQLLKGGFRSITGTVGQRDKKAYSVTTPVATIGIRGTDYTARLCDSDCQQASGLYLGVWQGGVSINNDAGVANIDAGQYAYVAAEYTSPVSVESLPASLLASTSTDVSPQQDVASTTMDSASLLVTDSSLEGSISPTVYLPKTGTATYSSVVADSVTASSGASFISSSATLDADFTNQAVDAYVNVQMDDLSSWNATASGMQLTGDGSFSGDITNGTTSNVNFEPSTPTGSMSGNLTGLGAGTVPGGASLDVNMQATFGTTGDETVAAQFTLQ